MSTPTSYFQLLEALWAKQQTFVILEQDILPTAGLIADLMFCREEWCAGLFAEPPPWWAPGVLIGTVSIGGRPYWPCALGCNKFSAGLQRRVPDAVTRVARLMPERYWPHLDDGLINIVLSKEERLLTHGHLPPVQDLHRYGQPWIPRIEGDLETSLRRVETSRAMLAAARFPDEWQGRDSRGGRSQHLDVLSPRPVDMISIEGVATFMTDLHAVRWPTLAN
jgi:hypothetical protein